MEFFASLLGYPQTFLAFAFFVLGSIIGSFIAALVIRWPAGYSIVYGRSSCDHCNQVLSPLDLIPIISFVIHRGKCQYCYQNIASLHWRIELMAACMGAMPFLILPTITAIGWALWFWVFLPLAILDYRHLWLPHKLIIISLLATLFIAPLINDISIMDRLIGAIAGYMTLEVIRLLFRILRNKEAMGGGDPKLLGVLGLYFGWLILPHIILIASCIGLSSALLQKLRHGSLDKRQKFPLGTYMIIATPFAMLISDYL